MECDLNRITQILNEGGIAILPTETVYGIFTKCGNTKGEEEILSLKNRSKSKFFTTYMSLESSMYMKFKTILKNDLEALTVIHNENGYRFSSNKEIQYIISQIGEISGTSINISGKPPITTINHLDSKFKNVPILNRGRTKLGLESTVFHVLSNRIERHGYNNILNESIHFDKELNHLYNKSSKFELSNNPIIAAYELWFIFNEYKEVPVYNSNDNSYLSQLIRHKIEEMIFYTK
jgi:tRNA A37 threonylcarbamoyladenosine synthetase subunit TsaC/SUA5/YrdC